MCNSEISDWNDSENPETFYAKIVYSFSLGNSDSLSSEDHYTCG